MYRQWWHIQGLLFDSKFEYIVVGRMGAKLTIMQVGWKDGISYRVNMGSVKDAV
jgi:hypothetical protein